MTRGMWVWQPDPRWKFNTRKDWGRAGHTPWLHWTDCQMSQSWPAGRVTRKMGIKDAASQDCEHKLRVRARKEHDKGETRNMGPQNSGALPPAVLSWMLPWRMPKATGTWMASQWQERNSQASFEWTWTWLPAGVTNQYELRLSRLINTINEWVNE